MPAVNYRKNLEIKTPVTGISKYRRLALDYVKSDKHSKHFTEKQTDIYYNVKTGRLKLRIIDGKNGRLIFYRRANTQGKRVSNYFLSETSTPKELDSILTALYGKKVIVDKKREIFTSRNVRIHIDDVKGLGKYLEFEVIFNSINTARKTLDKLIGHFKLDESAFIRGSYSDLKIKKEQ